MLCVFFFCCPFHFSDSSFPLDTHSARNGSRKGPQTGKGRGKGAQDRDTKTGKERKQKKQREGSTMSMINLTKVEVIDNPTNFFNPIQLEIEFEAVCDLLEGPSSSFSSSFFPGRRLNKKDREKLTTAPNRPPLEGHLRGLCRQRGARPGPGRHQPRAHQRGREQVSLQGPSSSLLFFRLRLRSGPLTAATNAQKVEPPDWQRIPEEDLVGVTAIMLTVSYKDREFIRVGYFVSNEYPDPEMRENPPPQPKVELLHRNILSDKPRVTRWQIEWD